jgi:transposase
MFLDYQGAIQSDGYAAYQSLARDNPDIDLLGCMAHARRKFTDAIKMLSNKEKAQKSKSTQALEYFKRLYAIEAKCRDLDAPDKIAKTYQIRQAEAIPILEAFHKWLTTTPALPKSPLGKAITYTKNQWDRLIRYCENGKYDIDNNRIERAIRPVALGRKNWLFADTPAGAHANARFYSLIETAKLHGHEPYAYLRHLFKELPKVQRLEDFEAMLPWNLDAESLKKVAREV